MKEKSEKKQIATIWALTILIVILIAIVAGLIFIVLKTRKDENMKLKQQLVEQQEQLEEDAKKVIEQTKKETKALKLDTSKDWVYDAEYEKNADAESYTTNSNNTYYAKDIIVPYINIDSSDADKVNNEIENIFESLMKTYNEGVKNKLQYVEECGYKDYINDNILSIILTYGTGVTDVVHPIYKAYNFDLETGKLLNYDEVYEKTGFGFNSNNIDENVTNAITEVMKDKLSSFKDREKETGDGEYFPEGTNFDTYNNESIDSYKNSVKNNSIEYYLDSNKNLNIVVTLSIPAGTGKFDTIINVTTAIMKATWVTEIKKEEKKIDDTLTMLQTILNN